MIVLKEKINIGGMMEYFLLVVDSCVIYVVRLFI